MKIILDAMGGDNAPQAPVMGALQAAKDFGAHIVLVGKGEEILQVMNQQGIDTLPEVREENEDYLRFITGENGILYRWLALGADGVRLDVADELPDVFLDAVRIAAKTSFCVLCFLIFELLI